MNKRQFKDLTGERFGALCVIKRVENNKHNQIVWLCKCDCGNKITISGMHLNRGGSKSCGCLRGKNISKAKTIHGMTGTKIHKIWIKMQERCLDRNNNRYDRYGGRGIKICDRWMNFINFKEDMYDSFLEHAKIYGEKDTSIERIDIDKDYCIDNCKWITLAEQAGNTSKNRWFEAVSPNGDIFKSKNQTEFARKNNLSQSGIWQTLNNILISYKGWKFNYINSEDSE